MIGRVLCSDEDQYFQICIHEFLKDMAATLGSVDVVRVKSKFTFLRKALRAMGTLVPFPALPKMGNGTSNLSVTIGPDFAPIMKYSLRAKHNYMYMFDCWPQNTDWVIDFTRIFRIDAVFFSAKQAADRFNERNKRSSCKGLWVPEGIHADSYRYYAPEQKEIDVLEFGRRYDDYHNEIVEPLRQAGVTHLYSKGKELLFKTDDDFIGGLAKSKISLCFPSSLTHPERAGDVSTMTLRYLQSMVSKCLIVGKLPYDMQYLFDYNPVVEIDEQNPAGQLLEILHNFDQYQELIERNYQRVLSHHRWAHRIQTMQHSMEQNH